MRVILQITFYLFNRTLRIEEVLDVNTVNTKYVALL
jgi:hypothetical protein